MDISSFLDESISTIPRRPAKRHATAMCVTTSANDMVAEHEHHNWGVGRNLDSSLEKSDTSNSSPDPLAVVAAQTELEQARLEEAEIKAVVAQRRVAGKNPLHHLHQDIVVTN